MRFAGHPIIGTAFVLGQALAHRPHQVNVEIPAGVIPIHMDWDGTLLFRATLQAPEPLSLGEQIEAIDLARAVGIDERDVTLATHPPIWASTGNPFVIAEVSPQSLDRAIPDPSEFARVRKKYRDGLGRLSIYLYARGPFDLEARMFVPLSGTIEDPATGSAATTLAALFLSLSGDDHTSVQINQGRLIGRMSFLYAAAYRKGNEVYASVGGNCIKVLEGRIELA